MEKKKLMTVGEIRKIPDNLSHLYKIPVYDEKGDKLVKPKNPKRKNKYTLNQLGERVDKLGERVDQLVATVMVLAETVDKGFKQINARIDYIVKANSLKDIPSASAK
ncbi:MAG: hypothetical protein MJ206_00635 [Bacilli bacterium]|nr:hypothetical protein [Bacilli bacterium]